MKVDGHKNLYRDENSGAIVNTDTSAYNEYCKLRERKRKEKTEIDLLKNEISEIKSLLYQLLQKNGSI